MHKLNAKSRKKMKRKIMRSEPHWRQLVGELVLHDIHNPRKEKIVHVIGTRVSEVVRENSIPTP